MKTLLCALYTFLALTAPAFAAPTVTSPTTGATVTSPVHYVASATTALIAFGATPIVDKGYDRVVCRLNQ